MFEAELPRGVRASRAAREIIRSRYAAHLPEDELETTLLLVSELVTNPVIHGDGKIGLGAHLDEDRLLVEVTDEGKGLERAIRQRQFETVEGFGLRIVDTAASRWGAHEGTTHVWFELERCGPRLGSAKNPASD